MNTTPNATRSASIFGCTPEQARRLFARNAAALDAMASKAEAKGGKINGYTAADLRSRSAAYTIAAR